jgi:hypothetical protein
VEESNERLKGWLMKAEKELQNKEQTAGWGKGIVQGLKRILF